jgi:uncharacterized protein
MKRAIIQIVLLLGFITMPLAALDVPPLRGHVNDYANMLSPSTLHSLEYLLTEFEKNESTQIVILTIPSLQGAVLEEFSIKVAEKWKIGQKKLDNGVIFLVSKNDRKMRIEVGYGLEGKLTDLLAGRIIDNDIKPFFKKGDYDAGISAGAHAIIRAVKGEYSAAAPAQEEKQDFWMGTAIIAISVFGGMGLIIIIIIILAIKFPHLASGGGDSSYSSSSSSSSSSYSSDSGGSSSSSSSDFSGGGGDFGGGGASGDW